MNRGWWREGWRVFARTAGQFFTARRLVVLLGIVVASAVAGSAGGWLTAVLAVAADIDAGGLGLPLTLAAAAAGAALFVIVVLWLLRDLRSDNLSSAAPTPSVVLDLQKAPLPDGYFLDQDTRSLVINTVRRRRRGAMLVICVAVFWTVVVVAVGAAALLPEPTEPLPATFWLRSWQLVFAGAVIVSSVRALAETTVLLTNAFGGSIPEITVAAPRVQQRSKG